MARLVFPGNPHHVTQRGNRRQRTFFTENDYQLYLALMSKWCQRCQVDVWAYCLMPNHVHLIAVPQTAGGLRQAIGEAHRRYTLHVNTREGWRGHLWQGRFSSCPMDEPHLIAAARYIEWNPVRAGIAALPHEYRWSSARAHLAGRDDRLVKTAPLLEIVSDWQGLLTAPTPPREAQVFRSHERSGRPLGDSAFITRIEHRLGITIHRNRPGRPRKGQE